MENNHLKCPNCEKDLSASSPADKPEGEKKLPDCVCSMSYEGTRYCTYPNCTRYTEVSKPQDGKQELPVMGHQLAAEADIAALDFGRLAASPDGEGPDGSELTDAYEAGQSWMWRKLQAEISSLKSRYEIVTADWNEEKNALQAEIELLRKSGATLRPDTSILDVIQWAVKFNVRMESGYWRMDYSSIAYTDNRIVEKFLIEHPSLTLPQEQSELSAYREALQEYAGTEMSAIATAVLAKYNRP